MFDTGRPSRRNWLSGSAAVAAAALTPRGAAAATDERADLILRNARIATMDLRRPHAEAIAIRGEWIVAVGSNASIDAYRGSRTHVVDVRGRRIVPGIIDSHVHLVQASRLRSTFNLVEARSVREMQHTIAAYARRRPTGWIEGFGWTYDQFGGSLPTRELLDEVSKDRPIVVNSYDFHSAWLNSRALEFAGITAATPDPIQSGRKAGEIVRDRHGRPTGVLKEGAVALVRRALPPPPLADDIASIEGGQRVANRFGITSVLNASGTPHELALYAHMRRQGRLHLRTRTALAEIGVRHSFSQSELASFEAARREYTDPWVRAGAVKFFADGIIETETAHMLAPYAGCCGTGPTNYTVEEFRHDVALLDRRGFQVITHAIGDGAVRSTLDAYAAADATNGRRDRRFRIEHIETLDPADLPRFAPLDVIASMMPLHCCPDGSGSGIWERHLGPERLSHTFMWHGLRATGARLVFGSDWPVVTNDPWLGLQSAVTRADLHGKPHGGYFPEQRVSLAQALRSYTRDAAHAAFLDDVTGMLAPGLGADLAVLSDDVYAVAPERLHEVYALRTIVGGRTVWDAHAG